MALWALAGVLLVLVAGAVVWRMFFALPAAATGLAPIPSTFPEVPDPLDARLTMQGEAVPLDNPDLDSGPGTVAVYRFAQVTPEVEAMMQRVTGPDQRDPDAKVEVAVGSARHYAEGIDDVATEVEAPFSDMSCFRFPATENLAELFACRLDYGNGWVLSAYGDVGLTGEGHNQDLRTVAGVAVAVRDHNAFERAVQNHVQM